MDCGMVVFSQFYFLCYVLLVTYCVFVVERVLGR